MIKSVTCCAIASFSLILILLESGDIGKDSEAHPCGEGEVWREAFDDTGIGGCYQEMKSLNNNNRRLNRFHVPLNTFHPSPRFPSASRWRPVIPHQNEDRHQFCGRCIINGRFQLCCKGDGIGPQSIDIRNVYFTHCDEYLKLAT